MEQNAPLHEEHRQKFGELVVISVTSFDSVVHNTDDHINIGDDLGLACWAMRFEWGLQKINDGFCCL